MPLALGSSLPNVEQSRNARLSEVDYQLRDEFIAQFPLSRRHRAVRSARYFDCTYSATARISSGVIFLVTPAITIPCGRKRVPNTFNWLKT